MDCVNEFVLLKKGYYWQWDLEEGMFIYKVFVDNLKIENDFYYRNMFFYNGIFFQFYQCFWVEFCEGGLEFKCVIGYLGFLCEVCESGYYK